MPERKDLGVTILFILMVITLALIFMSEGMDTILIIMLMNWIFVLAALMIFVKPYEKDKPTPVREFEKQIK